MSSEHSEHIRFELGKARILNPDGWIMIAVWSSAGRSEWVPVTPEQYEQALLAMRGKIAKRVVVRPSQQGWTAYADDFGRSVVMSAASLDDLQKQLADAGIHTFFIEPNRRSTHDH
jgi:hypothetical protein